MYILRCYGQRSIPKAIASLHRVMVCMLAAVENTVATGGKVPPAQRAFLFSTAQPLCSTRSGASSNRLLRCVRLRVLFSPVAHMQQLVAALLAVLGHHAYHDGIALGAFEHCRVVGLVQTVAALFPS